MAKISAREHDSREQFRRLAEQIRVLRSRQDLPEDVTEELIRLAVMVLFERMIEEKFEATMGPWADRFCASVDRYLEELL